MSYEIDGFILQVRLELTRAMGGRRGDTTALPEAMQWDELIALARQLRKEAEEKDH
jgi:hypothetical protein